MEMAVSCQSSRRTSTCPPWLQSVITDITQRVNSLTQTLDSTSSDTFADRAENYYQIRPQLAALLHDLHTHYLQLAHRYSLSLLKLNNINSTTTTTASFSDDDDPPISTISTLSDTDISSVCFMPCATDAFEPVVLELTFALIEKNILAEELDSSERTLFDSLRKVEIQNSLLEVMESERVVLMAENERLGYRAGTMESEAAYMRRKAGELAECVMRMREGRRVEMLARRVQVLERREKEWGEAMRRREREKVEARVELEKLREENRRLRRRTKGWCGRWSVDGGKKGKKVGGSTLWNSCFCL